MRHFSHSHMSSKRGEHLFVFSSLWCQKLSPFIASHPLPTSFPHLIFSGSAFGSFHFSSLFPLSACPSQSPKHHTWSPAIGKKQIYRDGNWSRRSWAMISCGEPELSTSKIRRSLTAPNRQKLRCSIVQPDPAPVYRKISKPGNTDQLTLEAIAHTWN